VVTWSSYNYPNGINSSGESVSFWYGPFRQRWKTIYTGSIGTETTYHVGTLLEKVAASGTTYYRHYIFAGNELVAVYNRASTGTNTLNYVLGDHQGSFAHLLTSSGTNDVTESFTAFGNRRSGSTWSGAPSSSDETAINAVSRWGYTGETVLGVSMGLNHLNGRVEDAITGRFLSPDPYIPDLGNTQSFNRYSYVNNNPLTLIDPTGFDEVHLYCTGADLCGGSSGDAVGESVQPPITVTASSDSIGTMSMGGGASSGSGSGSQGDTLPTILVTGSRLLTSLTPPPIVPFSFQFGANLAGNSAQQAQSQNPTPPVTPCPSGLAADVAYGLFQIGQGSVAVGKVAVAAGTGLAIIASPTVVGEVPVAALVAGGGYTALTGYVMQVGAGAFLASQGDFGLLDSVFASILNLNLPFVPSITPTNPFSSNFSSQASASTCSHP